jgi:rRNA maturation endonuclease Nob1
MTRPYEKTIQAGRRYETSAAVPFDPRIHISRFCHRCCETVAPEQAECPYCGDTTVPVDEQ